MSSLLTSAIDLANRAAPLRDGCGPYALHETYAHYLRNQTLPIVQEPRKFRRRVEIEGVDYSQVRPSAQRHSLNECGRPSHRFVSLPACGAYVGRMSVRGCNVRHVLDEVNILESRRAQLAAITLIIIIIIGTLQGARTFSRNNYDTFNTKTPLHGVKLLMKPPQASTANLASKEDGDDRAVSRCVPHFITIRD